MTWLILSHVQIDGQSLTLRFRPDRFVHDQDDPVREVALEGVENVNEAVEALVRFSEEFVVDLAIESQELRVLGEMDDEETVVRGTRVTSRSVPYSVAELRSIAIFFESKLKEETSLAYKQAAKVRDIRHFVVDLLGRAEKKQSLSAKPSDATEISALRRVLNRLDGA